nr:UDP-N-acetylenolpyruvoylglucosamine reductase [Nocardioidaceae bacterium]
MDERRDVPLAPLTTLRLGGAARRLVEVDDAAELSRTVDRLDAVGEPVLVLGGGSNAVVCDEPFAGTVVLV